MKLHIETFDNKTGGDCFFKAVGHPLAAASMTRLLAMLADAGPVAVYDPIGRARELFEIHPAANLDCAGVFVQDIETIGTEILGHAARPVTELPSAGAKAVLAVAFDAGRLIRQIQHLLPSGTPVVSLDEARLPEDYLANRRRYLDPLNFAVNQALLWDYEGRHTRIVTADYWSGRGSAPPGLWLCLFDADGTRLATWEQALPGPSATVVIDSRDVRRRFDLPEFCGTLFIHVLRAAGHDVVKYALDTYGDAPEELSCTHDANAWPADFYAGLPAPRPGETVRLWLQNALPRPVPAGAVSLSLMGSDQRVGIDHEIPGFGTTAVDLSSVLPAAAWPQQIELNAGRWLARPRYEVITGGGRRRIAHMNVERTDLRPDPNLAELGEILGKSYILPAPVLPRHRFRSLLMPTPMATSQRHLAIAAVVYAPEGRELARRPLGVLDRAESIAVPLDDMMGDAEWGHVELIYDFVDGGHDAPDGWLHALFRYEDLETGHGADTSFGAHIFNTVLTYRGEPQSYAGPAPGLSTRLFLRLGTDGTETVCHLIYPASTPWHAQSETDLVLISADGGEIGQERVAISL